MFIFATVKSEKVKQMEEAVKKRNHYDIFEVIETFNIKKNRNCAVLKDWMDVNGSFNGFETQLIEEARNALEAKWDEWNEEELKMNFISLILFVAKVNEDERISTFYERSLSGTVNNVAIALVVDCMLASPTNAGRPKSPYFFLQEFKRSLGDSHDPEGQMLAAMVLAQDINKDSEPLFGSWIQGRTWQFAVLNDMEYCVSRAFDATQTNDLSQIVFILRKLKSFILNR